MNHIRKISQSPVSLFSLVLAFLLFSCGQESFRPEMNEISGKELMRAVYFLDGEVIDNIEPLKDLKLENLFEGIEISEVRTQASLILDQIEIIHPGTFESFKADMTSGDHLLISESITRNAHLIHSAIKEINKDDQVFLSLVEEGKQPLAEIIEVHFPSNKDALTASQMKNVVNSDGFRRDISTYFNTLDEKINGRSNHVEEQMCSIIVGAAVLVVAAIAVAVIYAVVVLNAVETANIVHFIWGDEKERMASNSSLLKEQIVNSIANNFYVDVQQKN